MKGLENLQNKTKEVLLKLSELEFVADFTFVGGSALAVYLGHRLSEDIDLFTWNAQLDTEEIIKSISKLNWDIRTINLTKEEADFYIDNVKVTFFAADWNELKNREKLINNLYIAELKVLAVMKVNTLFLRAKYRDYYDLYVLIKEGLISLEELYQLAMRKIPNLSLTLFQRALTFTEDIEDENILHLQPKYEVSLKEIENFFVDEIKKWNKQIKNK